jgi:lipopolysaccharide/colanic/teichoic acid biosynthesis glycosyltransferase
MIAVVLLCIADAILVNVSFLLSFLIRFGVNIPEQYILPYKESYLLLTSVYVFVLALLGVYKKRFHSWWDLFSRVISGLFIATICSIAIVYVFRLRWLHFTVGNFIITFFLSTVQIFVFNGLVLRYLGRIKKKVIIIGKENASDVLEKNPLVEQKHINRVEELLQYKDVDEVVICERIREDRQLNLLIYLFQKMKVNVVFSPTIYVELLSGNMMEQTSVQFLATFIGRKSDWEEFLIRALDVLCSVFMLILLSPLIGLVSLLIKLTSSGSVFYKQTRVAKDGVIFTLYKFKTMINNAEKQTGPVLASRDDPRVTKIGRFLRNTRIDELPQLLNVIRGEMSLVGPRPERPYFVKQHKALREIRLAIKPGITGFAQIRNLYDLKPKHKLKYDYLYIQNRSFLLNLYILVKTIPVLFLKKGW